MIEVNIKTILRLCPFCGETKLTPQLTTEFDEREGWYEWFVLCTRCNTHGPISGISPQQAIHFWNTRFDISHLIKENGTK